MTISLIGFPSSHLVVTVQPSPFVHRLLFDFLENAQDVRATYVVHVDGPV